jgi:hypothetical protein
MAGPPSFTRPQQNQRANSYLQAAPQRPTPRNAGVFQPGTDSGPNAKPPSLVQRVWDAVRYTISGITPQTWFSPMQPLQPMAPPEVKGRIFDYPIAWNLNYLPRTWEPVSFQKLERLARENVIARLVIETRKDQVEALTWNIAPKIKQGVEKQRILSSQKEEIKRLEEFFHCPDGRLDWGQWVRGVLEQHFVYDAVALRRIRNRRGDLIGLEQIDAKTITLLIDQDGRTPKPPDPAYQQVLKGIPADNYSAYTTGDMIYAVKNYRPDHLYGFSPIEQSIAYAELTIARLREQLAYYTMGDVPRGIMQAPPNLTKQQISDIQAYWDSIFMGNIEQRSRLWWVPAGTEYIPFDQQVLFNEFDEWYARVICYAFSINPQPFIKEVNRATAQIARDQAAQEGLGPTTKWLARLLTRVIEQDFGIPDLEFQWESPEEMDPQKNSVILNTYVRSGVISLNEAREAIGKDPLGDDFNTPMFATPGGYVPIQPEQGTPTVPQFLRQKEEPQSQTGVKAQPGIISTPGQTDGYSLPGQSEERGSSLGEDLLKMELGQVAEVSRELLNPFQLQSWARDVGIRLEEPLEIILASFVTSGLPKVPEELLELDSPEFVLVDEGGEREIEVDAAGVWLCFQDPILSREKTALPGYQDSRPRLLLSREEFPLEEIPPYSGPLIFGPPQLKPSGWGLAKVTHEEVRAAALEADPHPSLAQRQAGNYKKGHIEIQGLQIAIENAAGSVREGKHGGWKGIMPTEYGYVKGTVDADGDPVDVFIGPHPESKKVFVVDQIRDDGKFDEHKCFIGYDHWGDAQRDFLQAYHNAETHHPGHGHHNIGAVRELSMEEFKNWLRSGRTKEPISQQVRKYRGDRLRKARVRRLPVLRLSDLGKERQIRMAKKIHKILSEAKEQAISDLGRILQKASASNIARILESLDLSALEGIIHIDEDLQEIAIAASRQAYRDAVGPDSSIESFVAVDRKAITFAKERAAQLVGKYVDAQGRILPAKRPSYRIDESTRELLRATLTSALEMGLTASDIQHELANHYAFSLDRSLVIARTEEAFAHVGGAMIGYREAAQDHNLTLTKNWLVGEEACEDCIENEAAGAIGLDEEFPSGDDAPPAHPNCRCDIAMSVEE